MTDEQIDRLVRSADRHVPESIGSLHGAGEALLEEIMRTPRQPKHDGALRHWRRPLVGALVAAAVLAVLVTVPRLQGSEPGPAGEREVVQAGTGSDEIVYTAAAIKVAENNPRLLIDEPGWKVTTVCGFEKDSGLVVFRMGERELEMNWYPARSYGAYYDDRLEISDPEPVSTSDQSGLLFRYSATDVEAILPADGPTFVMIRTNSGFADEADARRVLGKVGRVSVDTWLAAMPPEVVVPGKAAEVAAEIVADIPLPPGFDQAGLVAEGVNSRYHFGAKIVDGVMCGWFNEWQRAASAGDSAGVSRVVEALKTTKSWKILTEMQDLGGEYSEGPWELAKQVTADDDPLVHLEQYGCELAE